MPSIRDLTRRRAEPRTAFVLAGGGNLGAMQVGMLRALVERGIIPDVVLGCSVGALNGVAFAQSPTLAGVERIESMWLSLTGQLLMPSSRLPGLVQFARKGEALHDNSGLRASLQQILDVEAFEDLAVHFECVATDIDEARETWFSSGSLVEPVLASAAIPAAYPVVTIDGHRYLDGALVNNIPISRAIGLGCTNIWVLHMGHHGKPNPTVRRPADAVMIAYWAARNARFRRDLAHLPSNVTALEIPPGNRPGFRYDDFSHSRELIDRGHAAAVDYLDALEQVAARGDAEALLPWAADARTRAGEAFRSGLSRAGGRVRTARRSPAARPAAGGGPRAKPLSGDGDMAGGPAEAGAQGTAAATCGDTEPAVPDAVPAAPPEPAPGDTQANGSASLDPR